MYGYWIRWQAFVNACLYPPNTTFILSNFIKENPVSATWRTRGQGLSSKDLKAQSNLVQSTNLRGERRGRGHPDRRQASRSPRTTRGSQRPSRSTASTEYHSDCGGLFHPQTRK